MIDFNINTAYGSKKITSKKEKKMWNPLLMRKNLNRKNTKIEQIEIKYKTEL